MRAIQTTRYGYIWNHWSDGDRTYRAENMHGRTWPAMAAAEDPTVRARADVYLHRAPEERYDLREGPHGLRNLIGDPAQGPEIAELRALLRRALGRNRDPLRDAYAIVDAAVDFVRRQSAAGRPFFAYVAYTAPHWPRHAPEEDVAAYDGGYEAGWDELREQRLRRL